MRACRRTVCARARERERERVVRVKQSDDAKRFLLCVVKEGLQRKNCGLQNILLKP